MSVTAKKHKLTVVRAPSNVPAAGQLHLASVVSSEGGSFRIRYVGTERVVACDPSVDPALVEMAIASRARVVVEDGPEPSIVGTLLTGRPLEVDREGNLRASLKRFEVTADEALLKTDSAFLWLKGDEVEMFGRRILSRAREVARILARMIQLN